MQPVSRSQPTFICSMFLVRDCLHMQFRKIASELWLLWQLIGPIGLLWKIVCEQRSFFIFCWILMKLSDNNDMHKISDEFENWSDRTNDCRVTFLDGQNGHYRSFEQRSFSNFYWIFMKLADINNMDKISEKSENVSDRTNNSRVTSQ